MVGNNGGGRVNWKDEQALRALVLESVSQSEVLRKLGLTPASNAVTLRKYLKLYNIDTSHFDPNLNKPQTRNGSTKEPLVDLLTENSTYSRNALKIRLIKEKVLEYRCASCGNKGVWKGKKLSLQLEHKNGISTDNRLENLELLCPNCHSQTHTFAGRNKKLLTSS